MKYHITEENKTKALNNNRIFMAVNFGGGFLIAAFALVDKFNTLPTERLIFFILIIIAAPLGFLYFDKKFRNRLTVIYEIDSEKITITEKEKPAQIIPLNSIFGITKISQGYRIESKNGKFYIIGIVENSDELVTELKNHIK